MLIRTSCQPLSGCKRGQKLCVNFFAFFFFFCEQTHHRDSSPTALIKPCVHVSVGETLYSFALILTRRMPRNETPVKFIKKEKGRRDGVRVCAKNERGSEGGKKAVKTERDTERS